MVNMKRKSCDKVQLPFMVRILSKLGLKGNTLNLKKKCICKNPIENTIHHNELSKISHLPQTRMPSSASIIWQRTGGHG